MFSMEKIGWYCREFRINTLNMSLTEFSKKNGLNLKNVHAFEYGRANNIRYLYAYYNSADEEQKKEFAIELFNLL